MTPVEEIGQIAIAYEALAKITDLVGRQAAVEYVRDRILFEIIREEREEKKAKVQP